MLLYLYNVTLNLFITATVVTVFYALSSILMGRAGKLAELGGIVLGVLIALYRAVRHAFLSTRDLEINLYTFYIGITLMALMLLAILIFGHKKSPAWGKMTVCVLGALVSADLLFYKAWEVLWAPAQFETAGNGVFSTDFMLRLAGWLAALILMMVYTRFLYRCIMRFSQDDALRTKADGRLGRDLSHLISGGTAGLELLVLIVNFAGQILRKWRTNPKWRPGLFPKPAAKSAMDLGERAFAQYVGNNTLTFIILAGCVALIPPIVLFVRSLLRRGLFTNPAQKRRLTSNRRHNRRWALVVAVCFVLAIVNVTYVKALTERKEPEPEIEQYVLSEDGTQVLIPVEQVNDYNLHAFSMETPNKVTVRWIVVRKPNSGAYGVGLNACDVCGPAGYIQRGDTVVCVKCDVVMNTNTIGLPGDCNPVPLGYKIENGSIVIEMSDLIAAESRFKNR